MSIDTVLAAALYVVRHGVRSALIWMMGAFALHFFYPGQLPGWNPASIITMMAGIAVFNALTHYLSYHYEGWVHLAPMMILVMAMGLTFMVIGIPGSWPVRLYLCSFLLAAALTSLAPPVQPHELVSLSRRHDEHKGSSDPQ